MDDPAQRRHGLSIRPYPSRDAKFALDVEEAVDGAESMAASDKVLGELVQARLRTAYPNAIVRVQQRLARLYDPAGTIYAFRDGTIETEDLRDAVQSHGSPQEDRPAGDVR